MQRKLSQGKMEQLARPEQPGPPVRPERPVPMDEQTDRALIALFGSGGQ